jgi:ATP adenylyltransferase
MNPDCDNCQFLQNKPLKNQIITTKYWTVGIIPDQFYLGRALITLLTHKSSPGQLNSDEWQDFQSILPKLERAYKNAFGAEPLNIGCYMNNGFKVEPPHPHVHWHIFPRYKHSVELKGIEFDDSRYGEFYDDNGSRIVNTEVIQEIVDRLSTQLN